MKQLLGDHSNRESENSTEGRTPPPSNLRLWGNILKDEIHDTPACEGHDDGSHLYLILKEK